MQFPILAYKHKTPSVGVVIPYMNEHGVAVRFLEAVKLNPSAAWAFVSKICAQSLDLEALQEVLGEGASYRQVQMAAYIHDTRNCKTRSIYIEDSERNIKSLLHLRMIKEPDQYGVWKIYGVEHEYAGH